MFTGGVGFVVGVIMGHVAGSQIRAQKQGGAALAKAALIVGYIGIGLAAIGVILYTILVIGSMMAFSVS